MAMKVKRTEQVHIDEGEYRAVVSDIQAKEGNWGSYYIWSFLVKGATDDGEELEGPAKVNGITSGIFSEGSKLGKWAKAAGIDVEEDEIDLDEAKKAVVKIYIEDDETKDGRLVSKVSKVKKYRKGKKKVEEEEEEEEEEEKPKKKSKKKKTKKKSSKKSKKKTAEEDEDDEEDNDEDEDDDEALFNFDDDDDD